MALCKYRVTGSVEGCMSRNPEVSSHHITLKASGPARQRAARFAVVIATLGAVIFTANSPALGAFSASVSSAVNSVGTPTQLLTAKDSNSVLQCTSDPSPAIVIPATTSFDCSGNIIPSSVPSSGSNSYQMTLQPLGTASPTSTSFRMLSCAPASLATTGSVANNVLLPRYGVSYLAPGPSQLSGSSATQFSQAASGQAYSVVQEQSPNVFSIGTWFKVTGVNQEIIAFSDAYSNLPPQHHEDRFLFINSTGHLAFWMYPGGGLADSHYGGGKDTVTSANAVSENDGQWHFAVATVSIGAQNTVQTLYADGVQVDTVTYKSYPAAGNFLGYWEVSAPRPNSVNGSLSNMAVWPAALTAAQVTQLYTAGTQSNYSAIANSLSPTNYWTLGDTGNLTFAGPYPTMDGRDICSDVKIGIVGDSTCIIPATGPCSYDNSYLNGAVSAGEVPISPLTVGNTKNIVSYILRASNYTAYENGLQLVVPVRITTRGFTQTFTWASNRTVM